MDGMNTSILEDIKKLLGVPQDYEAFDTDIVMHINSAFSTLYQLGIGLKNGFYITGKSEVWNDLWRDCIFTNTETDKFFFIKQYVYLSVRLIFDPPASSYVLNAYKERLDELTWRIVSMNETFREEDDDGEEF